MRKIMVYLSLLAVLFLSADAHSAMVVNAGNNFNVMTPSQINTNSTDNVTDTFHLGPYESGSFQCAWAAIIGTQPVYILQVSNDGTNWDDVSGATTTTTGSSGSETWFISPVVARYARVKISTASNTGTLDCVAVLQGAKK